MTKPSTIKLLFELVIVSWSLIGPSETPVVNKQCTNFDLCS